MSAPIEPSAPADQDGPTDHDSLTGGDGATGGGGATGGDGATGGGGATGGDGVTGGGGTTGPAEPVAPTRPRRVLLLAGVALAAWALDLGTKVVAVNELEGRPPITVIDGVLYLQLVRNAGAAFAMATGVTWLLTLIAVGVVVAIVKVARRLRSVGWALALGLVLGGALGNLTDRLFRAPGPMVGRVVDFVSVFAPDGRVWPVFNVADSAICVGGATLVLLALLGRELDGTRSPDRDGDAT